MKRIFLIHPEPFYDAIVPELSERGVRVALAVVSEHGNLLQRIGALAPEAVMLSSFTMLAGEAPDRNCASQRGAARNVMEVIAPWEGDVIQMTDRLNHEDRSVSELRTVIARYAEVWSSLLRSHRPDAVVFHGSPHMGHDFVLYLLCQSYGILTLIVERTYLNERLFLKRRLDEAFGPDPESVREAASKDKSAAVVSEWAATTHYDHLNRALNDVRAIRRQLSYLRILRVGLGVIRHASHFMPVVLSPYGLSQQRPPTWRFRLDSAREHLDVRQCLRFYEANASPPRDGERYVFFPLHFEPERTTLPDGIPFSNQVNVARLLSAALPAGWSLLVREHPRQFRRGLLWSKARSLRFYEQLLSIPNVRFAPLGVPSRDLIEACRAVSTITGTAGWEALKSGKPCLVWGRPWYSRCPGVSEVSSSGDAAAILDRVRSGERSVDPRLVRTYESLISTNYGFRACFANATLKQSSMSPIENGRRYAEAISAAISSEPRTTTLDTVDEGEGAE